MALTFTVGLASARPTLPFHSRGVTTPRRPRETSDHVEPATLSTKRFDVARPNGSSPAGSDPPAKEGLRYAYIPAGPAASNAALKCSITGRLLPLGQVTATTSNRVAHSSRSCRFR